MYKGIYKPTFNKGKYGPNVCDFKLEIITKKLRKYSLFIIFNQIYLNERFYIYITGPLA